MLSIKSKPKKLIGITGKMGSGKTSIAKWFIYEHDFIKLAFADPLKEALVVLTDLPMKYFVDEILKETPIPTINKSPRELMQLMSTEFVRNMVYYDFWLLRMGDNISNNSHRCIIIDDVRFENEAEFIRDNGGKIVHLKRNFNFESKHKSHISETGIKVHKDDCVINALDSVELTALEVSKYIM